MHNTRLNEGNRDLSKLLEERKQELAALHLEIQGLRKLRKEVRSYKEKMEKGMAEMIQNKQDLDQRANAAVLHSQQHCQRKQCSICSWATGREQHFLPL